MEEEERMHIQRCLPKLIRDTRCSALLLAHLIGSKVLDVDEVDEIDCMPTPSEKATKLYRIVQTKSNGYIHLVNALQATNQSGAVELLTLPERAKRKFEELREHHHLPKCSKQQLQNFTFGVKDPTHLFTGRLEELEKLHSIFQDKSTSGLCRVTVITQTISISGLGGIGKTQLAREYIRRHSAYFDGNVIWMNAEGDESLATCFRQLAKDHLEIPTKDANGAEKSIISVISDVYKAFEGCRVLFIFDNAEKDGYMTKFLPSYVSENQFCPNILITSRDMEWDVDCSHLVKLGDMKEEEAVEFVRKGLNVVDIDEDLIRSLVKSLQCFPLAIQQAIAYINEENKSDDYSIKDYLDEFTSNQRNLLDSWVSSTHNDYQKTAFTTWKITLSKISSGSETGSTAVHLLNCIAYLSPENIERSMLLGMTTSKNERELRSAVSLLVRYSMLSEEKKQSVLSVHRLVQQVVRMELSATGKEVNILESVLGVLQKKDDDGCIPCDHALSAWSYAYRSPHLCNIFHLLPQTIVYSLTFNGGRYSEALAIGSGEMGMKLLETILPAAHPSRLALEYTLCLVLYIQCQYDTSSQKLVKLLELCETSQQENLQVYRESLRLLAIVRRKQGKLEEALKLNLELLESCNGQGKATMVCLEDAGICYYDMGKYEEALKYYNLALDKFKSFCGPDSESCLNVKLNISLVEAIMGNYSAAVDTLQEMYQKSIPTDLKLLILHNLAYYQNILGNYKSAREACEEALQGNISFYGELHTSTINTLLLKGLILLCMEPEVETACELLLKAYNSCCNVLGDTHEDCLGAKAELAMALYCKDHSEEALFAIEERIQYLEQKFGKNHHKTVEMRLSFAVILEKVGNNQKCAKVLEILRLVILESYGEGHCLLSRIAQLMDRIGRT